MGLCACVSVEEFDFENYETSKAESVIYKDPIVDKVKEKKVVVPKRMIAKVQKAKKKRAEEARKSSPEPSPVPVLNPIQSQNSVIEDEELILEGPGLKMYTPERIVDSTSYPEGQQKGAALLVWSKRKESAEVEIFRVDRPQDRNFFSVNSHFLHIMIFFEKKYFWRVRLIDSEGKPLTDFSDLKALQVVRGQTPPRGISSPSKNEKLTPPAQQPEGEKSVPTKPEQPEKVSSKPKDSAKQVDLDRKFCIKSICLPSSWNFL